MSSTVRRLGWFKAEAARASCSKRWRRSGSAAVEAGSTLIATSRPSLASVARYTSPIPPAPIEAVMRYWARLRPITVDSPGFLARPTAGRGCRNATEVRILQPGPTSEAFQDRDGSLVDDVARVESGVVNLSHDLRTAGLEEEGELLGEVDPFKARSRMSTYEDPKPPWKPRKQAYLRHLPDELSAAGIRFASPLTPAGRSLRERTRPSAAAGAEVLRGETPRTPPLPPGEGECE